MTDTNKRTVLIVDDDVQVLKSLKIWLRNEGFSVETAQDRDKALKILEEKNIDAALVDLKLIKDDGLSISKRMKSFDKHLKIIILTGYPSFDTAVEAMKIGAFDYLSKGSPNEKILETVKRAIAERKRESVSGETKPDDKDSIRVVLFCDHSLIKERLENISENSPVFDLTGTLPLIDEAEIALLDREPDIALICAGCNLKDLKDAPDLFSKIYRFFPNIKPVIINENFSNTEKVKLLQFGAKGFASRVLSSDKLEKGLLHVKKGGYLVDQQVINLSVQKTSADDSEPLIKNQNIIGLTPREIEILGIMARGLKNKEIGEQLNITEKTVKTHLNRIFKKLGVNSRSKAILTLMEKKII